MELRPYEEYKNSGIAWVGRIPKEWVVRKLRFLGILDASGVDKKIRDDENLCKSVHYMDVYRNRLSQISNSDDYLVVSADFEKAQKCNLKKGDVLFTNSSETPDDIGHSTTISEDLIDTLFGYHLMRFRPTYNLYVQYEKYLFGANYIRKWFDSRAKGITRFGINYVDFADTLIILPPYPDQIAIANYLDAETARISRIIALKYNFVEHLREKRTAIISHVVTKGLDPDVKMNPSGIAWIGDVPEGWKALVLKRFSKIKYGLSVPPREMSNGIPLIRATNIERGKIVNKDMLLVDINDIPFGKDAVLVTGDIIVVRSGAYTGDSALITEHYSGALAGYDMVVRTSNVNARYIAYSFLSPYILNGQLLIQRDRAAQPHLNAEELGETICLLPSLSEQTAIADYLDAETTKIDAIIEKTKQSIEKLKEYQTSLISACVTGKIDVRSV